MNDRFPVKSNTKLFSMRTQGFSRPFIFIELESTDFWPGSFLTFIYFIYLLFLYFYIFLISLLIKYINLKMCYFDSDAVTFCL